MNRSAIILAMIAMLLSCGDRRPSQDPPSQPDIRAPNVKYTGSLPVSVNFENGTTMSFDEVLNQHGISEKGLGRTCGLHNESIIIPATGENLSGAGGNTSGCVAYTGSKNLGVATLFISPNQHWNTITVDLERGTAEWEVYIHGYNYPQDFITYTVRTWNTSNGMQWGWETVTLSLNPSYIDWIDRIEFRKREGTLYLPLFDNLELTNK